MSKDIQYLRLQEALSHLKRKSGITQQKLAEMMGSTQTTISRNLSLAADGNANEDFVCRMNNAVGNIFDVNYIINGVGTLFVEQSTHIPSEQNTKTTSEASLIELAATLIKEVEGMRQQLTVEREAIAKERDDLRALMSEIQATLNKLQTDRMKAQYIPTPPTYLATAEPK